VTRPRKMTLREMIDNVVANREPTVPREPPKERFRRPLGHDHVERRAAELCPKRAKFMKNG
jgi:hypothetical protein